MQVAPSADHRLRHLNAIVQNRNPDPNPNLNHNPTHNPNPNANFDPNLYAEGQPSGKHHDGCQNYNNGRRNNLTCYDITEKTTTETAMLFRTFASRLIAVDVQIILM